MSTKVKVGIAAVILSALVALIVLDRNTGAGGDAARGPAEAAPADQPQQGPADSDAQQLFLKFKKTFETEPAQPAERAPIKGAEPPAGKEIDPLPQAQDEGYVIKQGDTLAEIARAKLGDPSLWEHIAKANPGVKANALRPGQKIVIPAWTVSGQTQSASTPRPEPPPAASPTATTPLPKTYEVQSGDTLTGISRKLYNTTRFAAAIFEANRDKLESPNDIRVGMKLSLPESASRQENAAPAAAAPGTSAGAVAAAAPPQPAAGRIHQVSPSESLWKIAEKYCGDKGILETIEAIVRANPDKLKDEKTMLRVGWQLVIPE